MSSPFVGIFNKQVNGIKREGSSQRHLLVNVASLAGEILFIWSMLK